jgi:microcystin-dependent protein
MADAYIGEIRMLPYINFLYPEGWLPCIGQQVVINQYQALFAIVGGLYGPFTPTQFYLPDLRGRAAMGLSPAFPAGTAQGNSTIMLNANQLPAHNHSVIGNVYPGTANKPASNLRFGTDTSTTFATYRSSPNAQPTEMASAVLTPVGQNPNQPHENRQPFLALQFCICWDGIWPEKP